MPVRQPITVAIAHFEDLVALGLHALLAEDPNVSIVAQDIAHDRLSVVLQAHRPDVLILDPGGLRDLAQVRELSGDHPHTRLVLLGDGLSAAEASQILAFGASACLAKSAQARDVRHAIHLASRGLQVMPLGTRDAGGAHARDPLLTRREGDVLLLLRQGRSNAQIALSLHIGVETVRTHARSIYRKLGVGSRGELSAPPSPPAAPDGFRVTRRARHPGATRPVQRRPLHD